MSINRYNTKTDKTQAAIIRGLEQAGVRVWIIKQPCDLLCLVHGRWQTLEVKTPEGKRGQVWRRRRMKAQNDFLDTTPTPVVTSLEAALVVLGIANPAGRTVPATSPSCTSTLSGPATSSVAGR